MSSTGHVIVVADGDVDAAVLASLARIDDGGPRRLVIAADGGAAQAMAAGVTPDIVVGDFDSLDPRQRSQLEESGAELREADPDKDESDMELSLLAALGAGATRISIVGALGIARPEHSIANLLLLADPRLDGIAVELVGRGSRIVRIGSAEGPGEIAVAGAIGDFVSLFPLGAAVEGVTTDGLRFGLRDESLPLGPSRGLSNELLGTTARVTSRRGCLLVVHTARASVRP